MGTDNETAGNDVIIHAVFVDYITGVELKRISYPEMLTDLWSVEFDPNLDFQFDPYKILIPLAFSFVGVLLVTCIVMVVRWCQAIRKRQRSRMSRSQLKKIPIEKYKPGDKYDCCTICLDDYLEGDKLRLLPCQHTYHQKCIDPWLLKKKKTCPVCKQRVIPRRVGRGHHDSESESDDERQPLIANQASTSVESPHTQPRGAYGATQGAQGGPGARVPFHNPFDSSDDSLDSENRRERSRLSTRPSLTCHVQYDPNSEEGSDSYDEDDEDPLHLNSARRALQTSMTSHDDFQSHSLRSMHSPGLLPTNGPNVLEAQRNDNFDTSATGHQGSDLLSKAESEINPENSISGRDSEPDLERQVACEVHTVDEANSNVFV